MEPQKGVVRALALRAEKSDPMQEIDHAVLVPGDGVEGEARSPGKRQITLLAEEAWTVTCKELDASLPWWTRRANVLLAGIDLQNSVDKEIHIGPAVIRVHGETRPCALMDELHDGLRTALKPDMRGGVFGEVLRGGTIKPGDVAQLVDQQPSS